MMLQMLCILKIDVVICIVISPVELLYSSVHILTDLTGGLTVLISWVQAEEAGKNGMTGQMFDLVENLF